MTPDDILSDCKITVNGTPLYKAKDVGDLLGIQNIRSAVLRLNDSDKMKINMKTKGSNRSNCWLLTESGVRHLLCTSRKSHSVQYAKALNIKTSTKYVPVETSFVNHIKTAFFGEIIIEQFPVQTYYIDMYFPKHQLAIEFDEKHHSKQSTQDAQRQRVIQDTLRCSFVRINESMDIFQAINTIFRAITHH